MTEMMVQELSRAMKDASMSMNELSRRTRLPRKRIGRIFKGGVPRETELVAIASVIKVAWEPLEAALQQAHEENGNAKEV